MFLMSRADLRRPAVAPASLSLGAALVRLRSASVDDMLEMSAEEESMMGVSVMGSPVYVKMCRCWSCLEMWLWLWLAGLLVVWW
jgi:hypothetical protein